MQSAASGSLSLDEERGAWVVYSNLHVLKLGGVPASADMREFAPRLWQEQTRVPAMYHMYNDTGLSSDEYIRQPAPRGRTVPVNECVEAPPVEHGAAAAADDDGGGGGGAADEPLGNEMLLAELWEEAKGRIVTRGNEHERDRFDTNGFSCRGIVPRPPKFQWCEA